LKGILRICYRQILFLLGILAMAVYQLVDQLSRDPDSRDKWIIERAIPGGPPIRLAFQGSRRAAMAEVTRLNAFLKKKIGALGPRIPQEHGFRTHVDALTVSAWSTQGFGMGSSAD
jgi:hypothetical protein